MKRLKTIAFLVVTYACVNHVSAQKVSPEQNNNDNKIVAPRQTEVERPRVFNNLPQKFTVNKLLLDRTFSAVTRQFSLPLENGLSLDGTIIERVQKNPNVVSINIRLNGSDSSLLNISRITQSDLSVSYIGRIINNKSGDILLLKQENGVFTFTKEQRSLVAVE